MRRRFAPLESLTRTMEAVDLTLPGVRAHPQDGESADIARLRESFNRMLSRLEHERVGSATAVLRAQEAERARVARDLHDEVNQALAAVSLRLAATAENAPAEFAEELKETQRLANQAMQELLGLARELRPSALDDHGLMPALRTQVRLFGERWGIPAHFAADGTRPLIGEFEQLVVYRVVQEALSNIARHAQRQEGEGHGARLQQPAAARDDHRRRRRLRSQPPEQRALGPGGHARARAAGAAGGWRSAPRPARARASSSPSAARGALTGQRSQPGGGS